MSESLIAVTTSEQLQPLFAAGQAVRASAPQLRHHLATYLGPDHAALFAEPVATPDGRLIE